MSTAEARAEFDKIIGNTTDADRTAKLELMREFFCNPEFRVYLQDEVARINGV